MENEYARDAPIRWASGNTRHCLFPDTVKGVGGQKSMAETLQFLYFIELLQSFFLYTGAFCFFEERIHEADVIMRHNFGQKEGKKKKIADVQIASS